MARSFPLPDLSAVECEVLAAVLEQNAEVVAAGIRDASAADAQAALAVLASVRSLGLLLDDAERILVRRARTEGLTWAQIGNVLHVTRQAAFQRFGGEPDLGEPAMSGPSTAEIADAAEPAARIVQQFAAGQWAAMRETFDARMLAACSAELLATVRAKLGAELGPLLRAGAPLVTARDRHVVVDVPLSYERGTRTARVTLDHDGRVAGFFVLLPGAA